MERGWIAAGLMIGSLCVSGCVDRLIRDLDGGADGGADMGADDVGPGDTDQFGDTETGSTTMQVDPGTECTEPEDCGVGQTCFEGVCVGSGTVRISLSWTVVSDLDLHLFLPNGDWMSFENPNTEYGELDVDDCVGGMCINQNGVHVENIFLDGNAPRGTYGVQVVNFDGRANADYSIEVAGAVDTAFFGTLPAQEFTQSVVHEFLW